MAFDHEHFMRLAIEEAARGGAEGNIAVASIIALDGAVVARAHNLEAASADPTAHAEILAVREAARALGGPSLLGSTLYTTWEPCPMCFGAIMASRITTVVIGARFQPGAGRWGTYCSKNCWMSLAGVTGWQW
jgi:tRNA(Arg) A34 adenosine deaminase TadA